VFSIDPNICLHALFDLLRNKTDSAQWASILAH
jgi:hypothetical protein